MFSSHSVWRLLWVLDEHIDSEGRIKIHAVRGRGTITPLGSLLNLNQVYRGVWGYEEICASGHGVCNGALVLFSVPFILVYCH